MEITVEGIQRPIILADREDYKDFLASENVKCLLINGKQIGFGSLVDGGTYTLGPPIQQPPPAPPPQSENGELLRGIKRQLEDLHQQSLGRPTPIDTPASLGAKSIADLKTSALISRMDASLDPSMASVLQATSIQDLSQMENEHEVVAFMTPVFEDILRDSNIHVVNSEEYPWLVTSSNDQRFNQKPDNIFCHRAIYNRCNPFQTNNPNLVNLRRDTDRYGVLADWALRDSIDVTGEAKLKIDNSGFGEVVNYARHICYYKDAPKYAKLLLYDKSEFWMIRATRGEITSVTICRWESAGSRPALLNFFQEGRSPWIVLLLAVCKSWNLEVHNDSFLGKGTFGRVFKVSQQDEEGGRRRFKALKLVLPGDNGAGNLDLWREKQSLEKAAKVLHENVVGVDGFSNFENLGAAMLLDTVGGEVPQTAWRQLYSSLGAFHEKNILHGDPRLANAIYVQGSVRWIDFRQSVVAIDPTSVALKRKDIGILVESCCNKLRTTMGTAVQEALQQYDGTQSSAEAIHNALRTPQ